MFSVNKTLANQERRSKHVFGCSSRLCPWFSDGLCAECADRRAGLHGGLHVLLLDLLEEVDHLREGDPAEVLLHGGNVGLGDVDVVDL